MGAVLLVVRLLLAALFLVAGLSKLFDQRGARGAIIAFGAPAALAPALAILLPLAELAVAAALLPAATAWGAALAALGLLLVFSAAVALNLARGRRPECHCFGELSSGPIGWRTLARNAALAALAGAIIWEGQGDPGASAIGWLWQLDATQRWMLAGGVALVAALAFQGWFLLQLFYQNGRLLLRVDALEQQLVATASGFAPSGQIEEGLPVGTRAPELSLRTLDGEPSALPGVRASAAPTLMLFVDPHCGPCKELVPEMARWQRDHRERFELLLISRGAPAINRASYSAHGIERVLLQENREAAEAFQVAGTPAALMVGPDGRVGSQLALGADQIRTLVSLSASRPTIPLQSHAGCGCGRAGEAYAS